MPPNHQNEYDEDLFLDELRSPYHRGSYPEATHTGAARNPLCGDEVVSHLYLKGGLIEAAWHEVRGCAISQVAASLLCRHIEGRTKLDVMQISPPQIVALIPIPLNPIRQRCAALCVESLQHAIGVGRGHAPR
jgi:nitrogen fixation NifU-like protein